MLEVTCYRKYYLFDILFSGKCLPKCCSDSLTLSKSAAERRTMRIKSFIGMAKAMAEQWTAC